MNRFIQLKIWVMGAIGVVGGVIADFLGGWDVALRTLILFMIADYLTAWILAGVFKKSPKTESGGLSSKVGWKGLCKKGMTLVIIFVCAQLDKLTGNEFIRDTMVIGYAANEALSIIENAGLMGIPIFKPISDTIDALKKSADKRG